MSDAWGTYLLVGNNRWKRRLIPHTVSGSHDPDKKDGLRAVAKRWTRV